MLPGDIVRRMEYYGQFEFSPQGSEPDAPQRINELIYKTLYPIASAYPDRFIAELAMRCCLSVAGPSMGVSDACGI
jgi:hypothetical protein